VSYEQKDMSGTLFKNDKGDNPKRPDYQGEALVDGTLYKIAAWIKEGKTGKKFMSLSFEVPRSAADVPDKRPPAPDDDSDLPF
jgi:uncharacterized protein (DUF736 family)